jgi:hypothetical protein
MNIQRMEQQIVAKRPAVAEEAEREPADRHQGVPEHQNNRAAGVSPAARRSLLRARLDHIFAPFSFKYFTAPGCHGIGEFFVTWFSSVMLLASP